ncbi:MAG: c-type cytochrome [Verrucomicrobium sp.]|nr:c-type cytochrome [Verrucomicrobium sp.]
MTAPLLAGASAPCDVPGYERLRAKGGNNWQAEAGRLLYSELSCAACHDPAPDAQAARSLLWKAGPDLTAAGDRLRAAYVREFLADPAATKPGTTMPNVLAAMPEDKKADLIEDLTHHLMGLRAKKRSQVETVVGNPKTGQALYLSIGCVACHGESAPPRLSEKYQPGELAKFLLSPLVARPSGRMPDQHLGKKEAAHLAAYLAPKPPAKDPGFVVDEEKAKRGRKAFASLGCISCHGKPNADRPSVPLLVGDGSKGCLAPEPKAGVPHYALTEEQRGVLKQTLAAKLADSGNSIAVSAEIRQIMLQRNCFACHSRDGMGGPTAGIAVHFTSTKDDLGDLGRLPPPLDGVGRKFQKTALESVLRGKDPVRTYMRVRMPGFDDDLAKALPALLAKADADAREIRFLTHKETNPDMIGRTEWGRELVGTGGYACIVCHDINGQPSLGIGAYDLAQMPKRLRPEWMRDFLLNPGGFATGSRMPPFWPQGQPMNPALGGGTAARQIDSIRRYLLEMDESLPPTGMAERAGLVLKPEAKPIIFRTFLKGTGTHAIAVGYPGGMNVAFDALTVRWSMAWKGKFLDADGTWNQRYLKMELPLGESLVRLEETGILKIQGQEDLKPQFRGYRLEAGGVPVFEYDLGSLHVEDRLEPIAQGGLQRTRRISGQTNEVIKNSSQPPANVKVTPANDHYPEVKFQDGKADLKETITW